MGQIGLLATNPEVDRGWTDPPRQIEGRCCKVYSTEYGVQYWCNTIQSSDCRTNDIYCRLSHRWIDYSEHEMVTLLEQSLLQVRLLEDPLIVQVHLYVHEIQR